MTYRTNSKPQRLAILLGTWLLCAMSLFGDTTLVSSDDWLIIGTTDSGPNPSDIAVTVDKHPAGTFSEIDFYYNYSTNGFVRVLSIKGNGALQPTLPPPGASGAAFYLTSYWDCDQGLMPSLSIAQLAFKSKAKGKMVDVKGALSNFDSLEADDLKLRLFAPESDNVRVDVQYGARATRDICVDETRAESEENFRVASMASTYLSADEHASDLARYTKVVDKTCVFGHCVVERESVCVALQNLDGLLLPNPRRLGSSTMGLFHTNSVPVNTPNITIDFKSPSKGRIKPQGSVTASDDPEAENVSYWGNWSDVKPSYRAGKKVCKVRCTLEATPPREPSCDENLP